MNLPLYYLSPETKELLLRVQPLMDAVDLADMPLKLRQSVKKMEKATGITTLDSAKRLLVLNAKGIITDDEYVVLIRQFNATESLSEQYVH